MIWSNNPYYDILWVCAMNMYYEFVTYQSLRMIRYGKSYYG